MNVTIKELERASALWREGATIKEIAHRLGVPKNHAVHMVNRYREEFPIRNHSAEWWARQIPTLEGLSNAEAAEVMGCCADTIRRYRRVLDGRS